MSALLLATLTTALTAPTLRQAQPLVGPRHGTRRTRPVLSSSSGGTSTSADPAQAVFDSLLQDTPGIEGAVALERTASRGRSLVTSRPVEAGEQLLRIPLDLCITAHRSGVCGGLVGQTDVMWEAAGDLREEVGEDMYRRGATWDVRLALGVLEATAGAGGPFWDMYRRLLPSPPQMLHPVCLPAAMQAELQDSELQGGTTERVALLRDVYPMLANHATHPATASYEQMGAPMEMIPSPLEWAYGLVTSRCFTMSDGDTFAFVPFLDLCQHDSPPAADFASDGEAFHLRALRPLDAGEQVTICYGDDYNSRRMFKQYGFAPEDGVETDADLLRELCPQRASDTEVLKPSDLEPLLAAFKAHNESPLATPARLTAVYDAITDDSAPAAPALLAALRDVSAAFPTSLDEDEASMLTPAKDPRARAVLEYRVQRKRLLRLAEQILDKYCRVGEK